MGRGLAKFFLAACLSVTLAAAFTSGARAEPAVSMDNTTGAPLGNGPFTLGFSFSITTPITVTALGVFDDSLDGLGEDHAVGLWDSGGNLVASATVVAGTIDSLTNQFRYAAITPITLAAGTYNIGAFWDNDIDSLIYPGSATNFQAAGGISFLNNAYFFGASLGDPMTPLAGNPTGPAYFGANFLFASDASAVPEPLSISLLGAGLLGLGRLRRRRR